MTTDTTRLYRFSASHRLHAASLTEQENADLYGKCNNPYGHGHDYVLEVTCTGEQTPIGTLDQLVNDAVLKDFAFANVNTDIPEFQELVPTTENIAVVIAKRLLDRWGDLKRADLSLTRIFIQETARNTFELEL